MEGSSRLSSLSSSSKSATKEEKSDESFGHKHSCTQESSKEDELESTKAKMKEVKEENARLKTTLEKLEKDYKSLQKKFFDGVNQLEVSKNNVCNTNAACSTIEDTEEEPEFVSLRLGTISPPTPVLKKDHKYDKVSSFRKSETEDDHEQLKCGLKLGLDYHLGGSKSDPTVEVSPVNSLDERKDHDHEDVDAVETLPPNKVLKTARNEDDEMSQQSNPKRARVSVRVRCDTPTMNDGCQWRKYGQKIAKGNPCPRAYYRCTVAPACPVRKQVQRCAEDMSILITTYEGTHNHQLAVSATAMASTTSAAASMLLSGSSSTQPGHGLTPATNLHGLNVDLSRDASKTRAFYLPNTSTPAFPTITLDLTSTTPSTNPFNIFSTFQPNQTPFPSKNLNFSSFESNNNSIPTTIWGNGYFNNYSKLPYNKPNLGSLNLGGQAAAQAQQLSLSYLDKNNQQPLTESITKALTSDPSFQSVIAAAISSMFSGNGGTQGGGERLSQILKWGESAAHPTSSAPLSLNAKGCASTYLTQPSSSSTQTGSLTATQPTSLPFSVSAAAAKGSEQTKSS